MNSNRILLVEDEEHLAFTLRFNLQEEGYSVDLAGTLQAARECLGQPYDLILLDIMLPDGSGFDLCEELRAAGNFAPVVMLTAKGTPEDIVTGLSVGADDYLTKPFSLSELLGRISAVLRRRRWENESRATVAPLSEFVFGDNRINFVTFEVMADGKPVDMTELELRLLRFFVDRPNVVVSREELLEGVWQVSPKTNTRTVDNFLVRLRKVFELDPGDPAHFLTVRGVGYRFVPWPD